MCCVSCRQMRSQAGQSLRLKALQRRQAQRKLPIAGKSSAVSVHSLEVITDILPRAYSVQGYSEMVKLVGLIWYHPWKRRLDS